MSPSHYSNTIDYNCLSAIRDLVLVAQENNFRMLAQLDDVRSSLSACSTKFANDFATGDSSELQQAMHSTFKVFFEEAAEADITICSIEPASEIDNSLEDKEFHDMSDRDTSEKLYYLATNKAPFDESPMINQPKLHNDFANGIANTGSIMVMTVSCAKVPLLGNRQDAEFTCNVFDGMTIRYKNSFSLGIGSARMNTESGSDMIADGLALMPKIEFLQIPFDPGEAIPPPFSFKSLSVHMDASLYLPIGVFSLNSTIKYINKCSSGPAQHWRSLLHPRVDVISPNIYVIGTGGCTWWVSDPIYSSHDNGFPADIIAGMVAFQAQTGVEPIPVTDSHNNAKQSSLAFLTKGSFTIPFDVLEFVVPNELIIIIDAIHSEDFLVILSIGSSCDGIETLEKCVARAYVGHTVVCLRLQVTDRKLCVGKFGHNINIAEDLTILSSLPIFVKAC